MKKLATAWFLGLAACGGETPHETPTPDTSPPPATSGSNAPPATDPPDTPPPDAPSTELAPFTLTLAPRMLARWEAPWTGDGVELSLEGAPEGVQLQAVERGLELTTLRSAHGELRLEYTAKQGARRWHGRGVVQIDTSPHAYVDGNAQRVQSWSAGEGAAIDSPSLSAVIDDEALRSASTLDGPARTYALREGGAIDPLDAETVFFRGDGDVAFGSHQGRAARFLAGQPHPLGWDGERSTLFDGRGEWRVGESLDAARFGDRAPRALRCHGEDYADCEPLTVPASTALRAWAIDGAGQVLGCATNAQGAEQPVLGPAQGPLAFDARVERGCWFGFDAQGQPLGRAQKPNGETVGARAAALAAEIRVAGQLGTWLYDARDGALRGGFRDVRGVSHAMRLAPWQAPAGVLVRAAEEPYNSDLEHACGHSTQGPFRSLQAATSAAEAAAPHATFQQTHTYYTVQRQAGAVGHLTLRNSSTGSIVLHLREAVAVRLYDPDGEEVRAAYSDTTDRCGELRAFLQFTLQKPGNHRLALGPGPSTETHFTFERGAVVERP